MRTSKKKKETTKNPVKRKNLLFWEERNGKEINTQNKSVPYNLKRKKEEEEKKQ